MRRSSALALLVLHWSPSRATAQQPQALFTKTLIADAKTSADVKSMLRSGRGFVEPAPVFADVTGDGKSDALVRVLDGARPERSPSTCSRPTARPRRHCAS